jgi:hypothetical protein
MLRRPTLLVIGAGAGQDINMPYGTEFKRMLEGKLRFTFKGDDRTGGDDFLYEVVKKIAQEKDEQQQLCDAGLAIANAIFDFPSIDSLMAAQGGDPLINRMGKLGIVRTILDAERSFCHLFWQKGGFRDREAEWASWYNAFLQRLVDGHERRKLDGLFDNLKVINFNYDRCLEHYLYHVLQRMFPRGKHYFADLLKHKLIMYRPYGSAGNLPWQDEEVGIEFGGSDNHDELQRAADGILTFNEEVKDITMLEELRTAIAWARQIIFLGFHFHGPNMDLLTGKEGTKSIRVRLISMRRMSKDRYRIRSSFRE